MGKIQPCGHCFTIIPIGLAKKSQSQRRLEIGAPEYLKACTWSTLIQEGKGHVGIALVISTGYVVALHVLLGWIFHSTLTLAVLAMADGNCSSVSFRVPYVVHPGISRVQCGWGTRSPCFGTREGVVGLMRRVRGCNEGAFHTRSRLLLLCFVF